MLKRQRPASPPLSISAIPFVDSPPFETAQHQSKRRRVLPPVLDGQARGWGETGHEDWDEEDDDEYEQDIMSSTNLTSGLADTTGYKSANGVLHELHTIHQRRLLSSPSPQPSRSPPACPSPQSHNKATTLAPVLSPQLEVSPDVKPVDESLRVSERYEDTNRFGSFVCMLPFSYQAQITGFVIPLAKTPT
jgi:hypothetical protein